MVLNIEVCIWKNWYQILQFVYEQFDIRYFCLYLKNLILNIEVCIWKNWY